MEKPWIFPGNKRQAGADHGRPRRFRCDEDRSKTTKNHLILTTWPTFFFSTTQKSLFLLTFSCHSKCQNKVPPKPELTLSRDDFSDLAHGQVVPYCCHVIDTAMTGDPFAFWGFLNFSRNVLFWSLEASSMFIFTLLRVSGKNFKSYFALEVDLKRG